MGNTGVAETMTPEEIEAFREWCRTFEVPADSMVMKALEHIDQQATALDEAEALIKKNADQINALLAQVAALQEIAIKGQSYIIELEKCMIGFMENNGPGISEAEAIAELARMKSERMRDDEARCQLSEEHREVFR